MSANPPAVPAPESYQIPVLPETGDVPRKMMSFIKERFIPEGTNEEVIYYAFLCRNKKLQPGELYAVGFWSKKLGRKVHAFVTAYEVYTRRMNAQGLRWRVEVEEKFDEELNRPMPYKAVVTIGMKDTPVEFWSKYPFYFNDLYIPPRGKDPDNSAKNFWDTDPFGQFNKTVICRSGRYQGVDLPMEEGEVYTKGAEQIRETEERALDNRPVPGIGSDRTNGRTRTTEPPKREVQQPPPVSEPTPAPEPTVTPPMDAFREKLDLLWGEYFMAHPGESVGVLKRQEILNQVCHDAMNIEFTEDMDTETLDKALAEMRLKLMGVPKKPTPKPAPTTAPKATTAPATTPKPEDKTQQVREGMVTDALENLWRKYSAANPNRIVNGILRRNTLVTVGQRLFGKQWTTYSGMTDDGEINKLLDAMKEELEVLDAN